MATQIEVNETETPEATIRRQAGELIALKELLDDINYDIGQLPYKFANDHPAARSLLNRFIRS